LVSVVEFVLCHSSGCDGGEAEIEGILIVPATEHTDDLLTCL